jgi:hypothetical protein
MSFFGLEMQAEDFGERPASSVATSLGSFSADDFSACNAANPALFAEKFKSSGKSSSFRLFKYFSTFSTTAVSTAPDAGGREGATLPTPLSASSDFSFMSEGSRTLYEANTNARVLLRVGCAWKGRQKN